MSNFEDHEAEQAALTALCEAGTCGHADCMPPARRTFTLQIAVSVRAYGSVEVEARSLAEAMEILRAEAAGAPGAAWDNASDVEWSSACEHTIISATDDDTGDSLDGLDLTPPDDPNKIITADELAAHIRGAQG